MSSFLNILSKKSGDKNFYALSGEWFVAAVMIHKATVSTHVFFVDHVF